MRYKYKKDLTGIKKGLLTIVSFAYYYKIPGSNYRRSYWNCICQCGNKVIVSRKNIMESKKLSCGCWIKENNGPETTRSFEEAKQHKINCILNMSHWENDCLIWEGYCRKEHPKASFLSKTCMVSRLIWFFEYGEIPNKKHVIHTCGNLKCINIKHLKLINPGENRYGKKHKKK